MKRRGARLFRPRSLTSLVSGALLTAVAVVATACSALDAPPPTSPTTPPVATPEPSPTAQPIRIGVSTTRGDTGWGAASLCSMRAEARLGEPVMLTVRDRHTDAEGQAADLRNLVAVGAKALLVDPVDPAGLSATVKELVDDGIVVVSIGRPIPDSGAYSIGTDQERLGEDGATWLLSTLRGKGKVLVIAGPRDDPVEQARRTGFDRALKLFKGAGVAATIDSKGDPSVAVKGLNDVIADKLEFAGIWTSGVDSVIVDALRMADQPYVPILGSDDSAFVGLLLVTSGLRGAVITDSPAVGGAALRIARDALAGSPPAQPDTLLVPKLWDNADDGGRSHLLEANDPAIDPAWPLDLTIPGWTEATPEQVVACGEAPAPS